MANDGGQGTTLTFAGSAIGKITDISFSENGTEVDVTNIADTLTKVIMGTLNYELSVTVIGIPAVAVGATGTFSAAFFNGTTETGGAATFILLQKNRKTSKNGVISTDLMWKPYGG